MMKVKLIKMMVLVLIAMLVIVVHSIEALYSCLLLLFRLHMSNTPSSIAIIRQRALEKRKYVQNLKLTTTHSLLKINFAEFEANTLSQLSCNFFMASFKRASFDL